MSYDVWLEIDTGAEEPVTIAEFNYTTNCARMWRHAGIDLRECKGAPCTEAAGPIADAVRRMEADPDTYKAMNPENGWGDYEGAMKFLRDIADACARHPKAQLGVGH
jgi:hypothetical protein